MRQEGLNYQHNILVYNLVKTIHTYIEKNLEKSPNIVMKNQLNTIQLRKVLHETPCTASFVCLKMRAR